MKGFVIYSFGAFFLCITLETCSHCEKNIFLIKTLVRKLFNPLKDELLHLKKISFPYFFLLIFLLSNFR